MRNRQPANLFPDCKAWWSFPDTASCPGSLINSGSVATILDLSGNGNTLTQRPTNRGPTLRSGIFTGLVVGDFYPVVGDYGMTGAAYIGPGSGGMTCFVVGRPRSSTVQARTFVTLGNYTGGSQKLGMRIDTDYAVTMYGDTGDSTPNLVGQSADAALSWSIPHVWAYKLAAPAAGSAFAVFRDGVLLGSGTSVIAVNYDTGVEIGYLTGSSPVESVSYIAEIMLFHTALSTADIGAVHNYLKGRYGIT